MDKYFSGLKIMSSLILISAFLFLTACGGNQSVTEPPVAATSTEQVDLPRIVSAELDRNEVPRYASLEITLALDDNDSDVHRILAAVNLTRDDHDKAAYHQERAIALNPNRLMHYIELGRTYAQMGREADARKFITKGLALPDTEKDDPESKKLGRQILKKLG